MGRRRFDHFFEELSVALGVLVPRYPLWLELEAWGAHPEHLSRSELIRFCNGRLDAFLADHCLSQSGAPRRRLERALRRFDPRHATPYEHMARLGR